MVLRLFWHLSKKSIFTVFPSHFWVSEAHESSKVVQVSSGSLLKTQKSEEGIGNRAKMILLNIEESAFVFWSLGGSKIFVRRGVSKNA